jgi:cytochrome P450
MTTRRRLPPGPRGHPLIGSLPEFRQDPLGFFTHCAREYGDICHIRIAGADVYLINRPDIIESVLVDNARNFMKGRVMQANRSFLGNGLLTSEGDGWLQQRRMMSPAFHRDRITAYATVMTDVTARLLADWDARPAPAAAFDIQKEMQKLTQRIVAGTLFSVDVTADVDEACAQLGAVMEMFSKRFGLGLLIPEAVPTLANIRLHRTIHRLDDLIYRIIARHQSGSPNAPDLLTALIHATEQGSNGMSPRHLRDQVLTLFAAGYETTAQTLNWAWYLLAQHPEVEAQLMSELQTVLNGRAPGAADVPLLKFTEMIVLETLRLYPPIWCLPRVALHPCVIDGYLIPPGASVTSSQWVMHRDPRYYNQPDAFRPERWSEPATKDLPRCAYFPFGAGPRQCIGSGFAMMEAVLVLAAIAQVWRFNLVPEHEVLPTPSLTLYARDGILVTAARRNDARSDQSSSVSTTHSPA